MRVIICLDSKNGTLFNGRRQSMDRRVRDKIRLLSQNAPLWMNVYSAKQFDNDHVPIHDLHVSEHFLDRAKENDFCFVEGLQLAPYQDRIKQLIIFYWNRCYPASQHFDLDLNSSWVLRTEQGFSGSSHDNITLKIYNKEEFIK